MRLNYMIYHFITPFISSLQADIFHTISNKELHEWKLTPVTALSFLSVKQMNFKYIFTFSLWTKGINTDIPETYLFFGFQKCRRPWYLQIKKVA
ncbi:MAG: hypothetical protein JXB88_19045 [Spirochaetales bacterium]|nr:hypothetical protein [Spirochaetales bacterium]